MKRLAVGLLGVGMIITACGGPTGGTAQSAKSQDAASQTSSAAPTSTAPAAPPPPFVTTDFAQDSVLKRTELAEIIGDTEVHQFQLLTKPSESSQGVEPPDCAPRLVFNQAVASVGYQGAIGDNNKGAQGNTAAQLITIYPDKDQPLRVVADYARMFGYCTPNEQFSTTSGDTTQHWTAGPISSDATDPLSNASKAAGGAQRQEGPPRNCYHATVARANTVVESLVCSGGDSAKAANEIAARITAKFPS